MKNTVILPLLLLSTTVLVFADGPQMRREYSPAFGACIRRTNSEPNSDIAFMEMTQCASNELKIQDRRLNENYQYWMGAFTHMRPDLRETYRTHLRQEERRWIYKRDHTCEALDGGNLSILMAEDCLLNLTTERATALEPPHPKL